MKQTFVESTKLTDVAIDALQEIKGQDLLLMDLRHLDTAVTNYFVICTGGSDRHVQALAESVLEKMKEVGEVPISQEGIQSGDWVLIDFVSIVIHIFRKETRNFYRLEDLWGDAVFTPIEE